MPKKRKAKKETRRSKQKYPELDPRFNLKTRTDLLDQDYLDKLSPKELKWLNKFNKEYVNASLENSNKDLHKSKKQKKECYDRNNARNRDILTRAKASNQLVDYEELNDKSFNNEEDKIIHEIDKKEVLKAIEWLADGNEKEDTKVEKKLIDEQNK